MGATIQVRGDETLDEIYFLLRTGTWHPSHLGEYIEIQNNEAYNQGVDDGQSQANDQGWEQEYHRGHADGFEEGYSRGASEGYRDGYADGSRESSYDNDRGRY